MPGPSGSSGWVRERAWIMVFSSTDSTIAPSGGWRYRPTTSITFSASLGSCENLNVSTRCGLRRSFFQIRRTVVAEAPTSFARRRVDQCVVASGALSVLAIRSCRKPSPYVGGRPERASSRSPSIPCSAKRRRHSITVGTLQPRRRAMVACDWPSAAPRTIAARAASPCSVVRLRRSPSSASRSLWPSGSGSTRRGIARTLAKLSAICNTLSAQNTSFKARRERFAVRKSGEPFRMRLVGGLPCEGDVGDELAIGLEGPGRVVREVPRRAGQSAQDDGRPVDLLLADAPDERRRDADEASCTVAALELRIAAGQLDLHIFCADRRRTLGIARLERVHECLGGFQRIGHKEDYSGRAATAWASAVCLGLRAGRCRLGRRDRGLHHRRPDRPGCCRLSLTHRGGNRFATGRH